MPDIRNTRRIAQNLGVDLSESRLRVFHRDLTDLLRTSPGGAAAGGIWGALTGTLADQADLKAELDRTRTLRYFLGE